MVSISINVSAEEYFNLPRMEAAFDLCSKVTRTTEGTVTYKVDGPEVISTYAAFSRRRKWFNHFRNIQTICDFDEGGIDVVSAACTSLGRLYLNELMVKIDYLRRGNTAQEYTNGMALPLVPLLMDAAIELVRLSSDFPGVLRHLREGMKYLNGNDYLIADSLLENAERFVDCSPAERIDCTDVYLTAKDSEIYEVYGKWIKDIIHEYAPKKKVVIPVPKAPYAPLTVGERLKAGVLSVDDRMCLTVDSETSQWDTFATRLMKNIKRGSMLKRLAAWSPTEADIRETDIFSIYTSDKDRAFITEQIATWVRLAYKMLIVSPDEEEAVITRLWARTLACIRTMVRVFTPAEFRSLISMVDMSTSIEAIYNAFCGYSASNGKLSARLAIYAELAMRSSASMTEERLAEFSSHHPMMGVAGVKLYSYPEAVATTLH